MVSGSSGAPADPIGTRELWVSDKFSFMPGVTPTAAQTGWSVTNLTPNRTCDCDVPAEVGDCLGQLITDLIAKGIISA